MLKRLLLIGLTAGVLAAIACLVYQKVYFKTNEVDFSKMLSPIKIIGACIAGTLIASVGYFILHRWLKNKTAIVFNFTFVILSFASILAAIAVKLPLDLENPELFPGLAVPMHFFPVIAWLTLSPLLQQLDKKTS